MPGVLVREGVFPYSQGNAFRPRDELKLSLETFEVPRVVAQRHPDSMILTDRSLIIGKIGNAAFDEANGLVRGEVHINKKKVTPEFLAGVKAGVYNKNSIGFLYVEDWTRGEFQGQPYDFVQRNILVDHLAVGVPNPRDPECVLGVDNFSSDISINLEAVWETAQINDLPDSSFAHIEPGGKKDDAGKTVPRSLRHLPYKNAQGQIDHDHLVNALARVNQSVTLPEGGKTAAKEKLCSAVRSWNREHSDSKIESEVCGTAGDCIEVALSEIERSKGLVS